MKRMVVIALAVLALIIAGVSLGTPVAQEEVAMKVTLCHHGEKTISIGAGGVPAHLRHGDTLGPCP